jgi:hypothetical protein
MTEAGLISSRPQRRLAALSIGGLLSALAVLVQAYMARWFASHTPEATWRILLGLTLGLAAPIAGVMAFVRGNGVESQGERIGHVEYVVAVIGLSLIVPTLVLIILSGGYF